MGSAIRRPVKSGRQRKMKFFISLKGIEGFCFVKNSPGPRDEVLSRKSSYVLGYNRQGGGSRRQMHAKLPCPWGLHESYREMTATTTRNRGTKSETAATATAEKCSCHV